MNQNHFYYRSIERNIYSEITGCLFCHNLVGLKVIDKVEQYS